MTRASTTTPASTTDPRAVRTRDAIVAAFNRLVLRRRSNAVPVHEIISAAGVGRSTFYDHFRNTDELLTHAADGILAILADAVLPAPGTNHPSALLHAITHFLDVRPAALAMLRGPAGQTLTHRLSALIEIRLSANATSSSSDAAIPLRLRADQIAASQFALVRAWLESATPIPAQNIADSLRRTSLAMAMA